MKNLCLTLLFFALFSGTVGAQDLPTLPLKVNQVEIRDASNNPMKIPYLGQKHLLIFYIDPDKPYQNKDFTDYLEDNQIESDNIFGFGVVNLKDAPMLPNGIVRSMVRGKIKKTGADIYTDVDHSLRDGWKLGDCNNKFTLMFVTKDKEIVYMAKGEMSQAQRDEFFRVIEKYK